MDDLEHLLLSERKRMLICHSLHSKSLSVKPIPDFSKEWPGLPKGVKFDPSDEELLCHLLAEIGKGALKRHPFIHEFIFSLNDDDTLGNIHPQFLPGVKQDGSLSYFFHRKVDLYGSRKMKRQKKHDNSVDIYWHSIGKLNLVCVDGIHQGSKEVLNLYMGPRNGGNPVRTPWLMHQYHVGIDGAEEDLVVSKIFYEMWPKQIIQDSQTDSVDGFVAEAPEFLEGLHAESVSAELTTEEHYQKVYLKSTSSQNCPTTCLEKGKINYDKHSEGSLTTDELPLLDSPCETAAEISTSSTSAKSEISVDDQREYEMGKRTDVFLVDLDDFKNSINNSNCDKLTEETESKVAFQKNSSNWANISAQPALSIKIEPKSFEDAEIGIDISSENFSNNWSNVSASPGLLIKVKSEPFIKAEASSILEKYVDNFMSFSQSSGPVDSSDSVNFCLPKTSIQENNIPHFYISKESIEIWKLSHQDSIPEHIQFPNVEDLSNKISSLDELLKTTGFINQHPENAHNDHGSVLMSNDKSHILGGSECHPQINAHPREPQSNSVSSSSSLNVKSEPLKSSVLTYSHIPPCDTREHASLKFENDSELYSDYLLDMLDHVPLKYRLGISVSEGDANFKSENISEALLTPSYHSFGSVNTEECISFSRRKRKKTATNSVEKALEEDAPGLLKALLVRGVQVEEIKLYGDLEDNDLLETSSSVGSFEELGTLMTKFFSERSSLLRFTSGQPVMGSRAIYCLAGLISLIEQARYLRFRQTPVDWGWCRDLQSFIFVFQTHNRIVLERPEYGYATYFFELVDSLPIEWQIKRLVKAMKLTNCSRTILLENKPLIVGKDLSEGEARILEAYGWVRNTGFGTLLNYVDRVVHDRRDLMCNSEWRLKIQKMLMSGYDGGRLVLTNIPEKVLEYLALGCSSSEIKMKL